MRLDLRQQEARELARRLNLPPARRAVPPLQRVDRLLGLLLRLAALLDHLLARRVQRRVGRARGVQARAVDKGQRGHRCAGGGGLGGRGVASGRRRWWKELELVESILEASLHVLYRVEAAPERPVAKVEVHQPLVQRSHHGRRALYRSDVTSRRRQASVPPDFVRGRDETAQPLLVGVRGRGTRAERARAQEGVKGLRSN